jgi:thiosulfate reductase cytochrome b subunit
LQLPENPPEVDTSVGNQKNIVRIIFFLFLMKVFNAGSIGYFNVNILKHIKKVQKMKYLKITQLISPLVILSGTLLNFYLLDFFCN